MLSKLRYVSEYLCKLDSSVYELEIAALKEELGSKLTNLTPFTGGTFGINFSGHLDGQPRFFKTYATADRRITLEREQIFLEITAGHQTDPVLLNVPVDGSRRTWLHTKTLNPSESLEPAAVRKLIDEYDAKLEHFSEFRLSPSKEDNFNHLLSHGESALELLVKLNLLSPFVRHRASYHLACLRSNHHKWQIKLCHGDLSPANILHDGHNPIALDWEDAYWGFAGYDYLYWLTFFSNRKWLLPSSLGHGPLRRGDEIAIMVMILLLKSFLSVRNDSYRKNNLTIDQRLREVIELE